MNSWKTQQNHLRTHNLFYSAVHGEVGDSLVDLGYRVTGEFTIAENRKKDARCQPAFTLFNGQNLLFVDIVRPGTISDQEIRRLSQYNKLDREAVEEYLNRCDFSTPGYGRSDLDNFDSCFVMPLGQYETHSNGEPKLQENLERLKKEGCIATISPGGVLEKQHMGVHGTSIDNALNNGISVPEKTGKYVHLSEEVHKESLAVAICEEIVAGSDLRDGGKKLQESDVGSHFEREIGYDIAHEVLEYLRKIDACRIKREESSYTFTKYNLNVILNIRNRLISDPIDETLSDDVHSSSDQNASLADFS